VVGVDVKSVCTYWTVYLFGLPRDADVAGAAAIGVKNVFVIFVLLFTF